MIIVDAGPLVALVDADDQHHSACVEALREITEPLATVWPAFTEAMYLLAGLPKAQEGLWEFLDRNAFHMLSLDVSERRRMRDLMRKYADRPMDLADAAIIAAAEREGIRTVFTVDKSDFRVYRLHGRLGFNIIP